jgi:cysteine-rich secretory family protein
MESRRAHPAFPAIGRLLLAAVVCVVVLGGFTPLAGPGDVRAGTAETMESHLVGWINSSRAKLGLHALRVHAGLTSLAGYRAGVMASTGVMSHTIAGCLSCSLISRGIQKYSDGEAIAENTYTWGDQSALALFNWWKGSPEHWGLLISRTFNYFGVGVAYRSSNRMTFGSVVLTESVDQTGGWSHMVSGSASSTTISWSWSGGDLWLQTHTAGLRNFDVEYRVDYGAWSLIRSATTAKWLSLSGRAHGHYYAIRIRSRDWRGNMSAWSAEIPVWVR